jgi:histidinol-phosphatase (PHP family)
MHTPLCNHAKGDPEEYAAAAEARNLKGIIFTCHNPGPNGFSPKVRMRPDQFDAYVAMVARARDAYRGRVDVRLGLECDYLPDMEDYLADLLQRADFHHVLGSVHPQLPYYRRRYDDGDARAMQRTYFQHLAQAAESGLFDTISHPDLVKNVYSEAWHIDQILDLIRETLDRIAAAGVAMELNTSGVHKRVREMNPNPTMLAEMRARHIPVVIGSDAHEPKRVAADFEQAFTLLEEAGYEHTSFFLERRRHTVPIAQARASLQGTPVTT